VASDPPPADETRAPRLWLQWRPAARLLCLALILATLRPAPALVIPGPPQTVQTRMDLLGVHTRLTDEVEPWKIKRSLQMVREMGAPWIVEFFPWAYYAAADGSFAWSHPDLIISHAEAQGLTVVARLGLTPAWARPPDTSLNYLDTDGYQAFAAYAAAFAERYRGRVAYIIVGNEPNLSFEWGYRTTTPHDYVELLQVVYPAVKAANAEMGILAGALAPTLEPPGSPWGLNDLIYLEGMYEAGAAPYFDALAVHTYGFTFPPEAEPGPQLLNFRRVELLREIMVAHGDEHKPMLITEMGWNDHPRWTRAVRPAQRIQYTLDAFRYAEAHWPYVKLMAIWVFRFPAPARSYMDYFTLVTPEFVARPLYDELRLFTGN
jgi:polysaccharide biosynthesis protein PslG